MANIDAAWVARAKELLAGGDFRTLIPFGVSFLAAIYGKGSAQFEAYNNMLAQIAKQKDAWGGPTLAQQGYAYGVIENTVAEIERGLITSLRAQIAGEVLTDFVALGKEFLTEKSDSSKNVSAVLIAAAFEDLMRRMGSELAGVVGRPKLEEMVNRLKDADVLKGGEVGTALSYLKFRNDSLHADWANVDRPQIQSCISFIEELLVRHFS